MSGTTEPRAALVSFEDQVTIMAFFFVQNDAVDIEEVMEAFVQSQQVVIRAAQYSQPIREVQIVCNLLQHIINLQRQITDQQRKQVSACTVRLYGEGATNMDSDQRPGQSQREARNKWNKRGATAAIGGCDSGSMAMGRGCPQFEDAVSKCLHVDSLSSPGSSPAS
jgi:hypothetical protein